MNVSALRLAASAPTPTPTPTPFTLWRVDLDQPVAAASHASLSAGELARAARFVFARDRQRYIAAHAALRQVLAQHLADAGYAAPVGDPLAFVAGRFGKPALAVAAGLHFNLSHSHGTGLVAVSQDSELGVDVEQLRPMTDAVAMAAAYFTPAEQSALVACDPGAARDRAFLTCWTRKEACLKALGIGLYLATRGFEVGVLPSAQVVEIATPEGIEHLHLHSFADGDLLGALALRCASSRSHHAGAPTPAEVQA